MPRETKYFGKRKQVCLTASFPMALLEQMRLGALRVIRYEERTEKSKQWYMRAEADTILDQGLLQDSEFASYMREKYPESWELARRREKET